MTRALVRRLLRLLRDAWIICGISLALFLLLNLVAKRWVHPHLAREALAGALQGSLNASDPVVQAGFLAEAQAPLSVLDRRLAAQWRPYVYWRSAPCDGKMIRVNSDGLRRTVPSRPATDDTVRVFMFGGSAMWGYGARDEFTIASRVQQALIDAGHDVQVTNYGQLAYVSTQELLTLMLECQHKHVPHVAVFYDGANDLLAVEQNMTAGETLTEPRRRLEFDVLSNFPFRTAALVYWKNTALHQLLNQALTPFSIPSVAIEGRWDAYCAQRLQDPVLHQRVQEALDPASGGNPDERQLHATRIMIEPLILAPLEIYSENLRLASALANHYDFDELFYWQPVLKTKSHPSPEEKKLAAAEEHDDYIRLVCERLLEQKAANGEAGSLAAARYLGDFFNTPEWQGKTAFFDTVHLTEEANQAIGDRIAADLAPLVKYRRQALRQNSLEPAEKDGN